MSKSAQAAHRRHKNVVKSRGLEFVFSFGGSVTT